ncbi:MAG TPA: type II toxin-antitoxin system VapC family toxin [Kutzneria sp.]
MIYLDSCALVKLVMAETETAALRARLDDHETELVTSELALTEVIRVVRRSCYDAQRRLRVEEDVLQRRLTTAGDLLGEIDHVVVDTDTFLRAGMFADDPHLGSLDALHLVCALELGVALTAFVTYDKALANAALQLGLPVEQPGT